MMFKYIRNVIILIGIFSLTSCASPPVQEGNYFALTKAPPPADFAKIYIYNPYKKSAPHNRVVIFIDNQKIADLPGKTYTTLLVSSGAHMWGILYKYNENLNFLKPNSMHIGSFIVDGKKTYFLKFSHDLNKYNTIIADPEVFMTRVETKFEPVNSKMIITNSIKNTKEIYRCRHVIPMKNKIGKVIK